VNSNAKLPDVAISRRSVRIYHVLYIHVWIHGSSLGGVALACLSAPG